MLPLQEVAPGDAAEERPALRAHGPASALRRGGLGVDDRERGGVQLLRLGEGEVVERAVAEQSQVVDRLLLRVRRRVG